MRFFALGILQILPSRVPVASILGLITHVRRRSCPGPETQEAGCRQRPINRGPFPQSRHRGGRWMCLRGGPRRGGRLCGRERPRTYRGGGSWMLRGSCRARARFGGSSECQADGGDSHGTSCTQLQRVSDRSRDDDGSRRFQDRRHSSREKGRGARGVGAREQHPGAVPREPLPSHHLHSTTVLVLPGSFTALAYPVDRGSTWTRGSPSDGLRCVADVCGELGWIRDLGET